MATIVFLAAMIDADRIYKNSPLHQLASAVPLKKTAFHLIDHASVVLVCVKATTGYVFLF